MVRHELVWIPNTDRIHVADAKTYKVIDPMVGWEVAAGEATRQFDLDVVHNGMPQDPRHLPDGSAFLVADMHPNGMDVFDSQASARIGFGQTGNVR